MTGRSQKGNTYAKPTLKEQKSWPMRHVSGSYPHRLKISSRSFFLLPPAFQSFQISSETFLEPLARGVKIRLDLLRIASGDRWCSPTLKRGARASCMSGISSETPSKESKGSGTGGVTGCKFIIPLADVSTDGGVGGTGEGNSGCVSGSMGFFSASLAVM